MSHILTSTVSETALGRHLPNVRIPTVMFDQAEAVAKWVAHEIAALIRGRNRDGSPTVLGLATGSTPIGVYAELIRMHKEEGLDFSNVITFNLDEYLPMEPDSPHSYVAFMWDKLFHQVNIDPRNVHIPNGRWSLDEVDAKCREYEDQIESLGGLDLQLLGIGRTGHVGFNEPGSGPESRTRLVELDELTRGDAAGGFGGIEHVPTHAVTMGVGTIRQARRVILMALGDHKASIVRETLEGIVRDTVPATYLQWESAKTLFVVDKAAATELTAMTPPWLRGRTEDEVVVDWNDNQLVRQAVIWLAQLTKRPIMKLTEADFAAHRLANLVEEAGSHAAVCERVRDELTETLCTNPGGDARKRVIVFSPHPDDDVISMGGTLIRLARDHDVHVVYMTSGSNAVFDHDAIRHVEFAMLLHEEIADAHDELAGVYQELHQALLRRESGQSIDPDTHRRLLRVKALIRQTEATSGAGVAGIPSNRLHFPSLPFYEGRDVEDREVTQADVDIIADIIRDILPEQVYVAGDFADPHGTHRLCADVVIRSTDMLEAHGIHPEIWMYRGAWQEYEAHEIERAVVLDEHIVMTKREAIYRHESQKDCAMFPGTDDREFWERAETRTEETARVYRELGICDHLAIEALVRFRRDD
ncbi:MAG: glucosamine-6-phosphate deaminase [Planctomycetota bacterium]|nr:glucosamine-6-phosphate deaminase [Planctomycetota bacterium]